MLFNAVHLFLSVRVLLYTFHCCCNYYCSRSLGYSLVLLLLLMYLPALCASLNHFVYVNNSSAQHTLVNIVYIDANNDRPKMKDAKSSRSVVQSIVWVIWRIYRQRSITSLFGQYRSLWNHIKCVNHVKTFTMCATSWLLTKRLESMDG